MDRVISFYYERVLPHTQCRLNDLAVEDLEFLMQNFYGSAYSRFRDEVGPLHSISLPRRATTSPLRRRNLTLRPLAFESGHVERGVQALPRRQPAPRA